MKKETDIEHFGKIPPSATDLEEIVLGAIMLEKDCMETVLLHIDENDFYLNAHQLIFWAAHKLHKESKPIDMLTVITELRSANKLYEVGGVLFISQLTNKIGSTAHVEYHSLIIKEKSLARKQIRLYSEQMAKLYEASSDPIEVMTDTQQSLEKMGTHVSTDISIAAVYEAAVDTIKRASESKTGLSGTTTGYDSIDSFTGGFAKGDLIILAGLPGTFKSALAISFIWKAAKRGTPTHMFQLEMDRSQVGMRIIAAETGIDINRLKTGRVSDTERAFVEKVEDRIVSTPMSVDVSSNLTISQIINSSAKVVRERGVEIIVVDYLQDRKSTRLNSSH